METEVFSVHLVNFGTVVWQGHDFAGARLAAEITGFECAIYSNATDTCWFWSPISGLRKTMGHLEEHMT